MSSAVVTHESRTTADGAPPRDRPVNELHHVGALDGFRGLAVLLVVVNHIGSVMPSRPTWFHGGWVGVDLFFVLSGFLITSLLLRERGARGDVSYGAFYMRRALRLLPALYVFLAGLVAYRAATDLPLHDVPASVGSALLYASNWQATFRG